MLFVALTGWKLANGSAGVFVVNLALLVGLAFVCCVVDVLVWTGVARALGDRAVVLMIGSGPRLFRWASKTNVSIVLYLVPMVSKAVIATTRRAGQRSRLRIMLAANGIVFAAIAIALVIVQSPSWAELRASFVSRIAPDSIAIVLALSYGVIYLLSAITATYHQKGLDASLVLGHLFAVSDPLGRGANALAEQAARAGLADVPESDLLQAMLAQTLLGRDDDAAFALATQLLERELPPQVRAAMQNIWAWHVYINDLDEHRTAADEATKDAVEVLADSHPIVDTRGHVLLWLGRRAEAEPLLQRAYANGTGSTKTSSAAGLAMLYARGGRIDEAHAWLERARQEPTTHQRLVARAIATVEPLARP